MVRSLLDFEARRGAGKVSPLWVKLHTLSPGQTRARGHRWVSDRTKPFVTTTIDVALRNSTDVCPSKCFAADISMCSWVSSAVGQIWQRLVCSLMFSGYIDELIVSLFIYGSLKKFFGCLQCPSSHVSCLIHSFVHRHSNEHSPVISTVRPK